MSTINYVLNPYDKPYTKHAYRIEIGYRPVFSGIVFADCLSDAIDLIIDHWQEDEKENLGYFLQEEIALDFDSELCEHISGGNNGRVTVFLYDELHAEEFYSDDVNLYAKFKNNA